MTDFPLLPVRLVPVLLLILGTATAMPVPPAAVHDSLPSVDGDALARWSCDPLDVGGPDDDVARLVFHGTVWTTGADLKLWIYQSAVGDVYASWELTGTWPGGGWYLLLQVDSFPHDAALYSTATSGTCEEAGWSLPGFPFTLSVPGGSTSTRAGVACTPNDDPYCVGLDWM